MNTTTTAQRMTAESVHRVCQDLWNEGHIVCYTIERFKETGEALAHVRDNTGEEFYIETNFHGVWFNRGQDDDTMDPHFGPVHTPGEAADYIVREIYKK